MNIALLAGARPNFIKAAPLWRAFQKYPDWKIHLIHTGQHRDANLSSIFFQDLGLPEPNIQLNTKASSSTRQTARILQALETVFQKMHPDWVIVIGDVTSTLAGALVAKQLGLKVAHVEAGLRSGDRSMPEELNRIAVDHLADLLFASEESGLENLRREGIPESRICFSGNVLIDALVAVLPEAKKLEPAEILKKTLRSKPAEDILESFALCTFHRPSNVDVPEDLCRTFGLLENLSRKIPLVFPCHPRTIRRSKQYGLYQQLARISNLWLLPPLSYSEMIALTLRAQLVVTDSGGLQEETTFLHIPCLTFRENTERPSTLVYGTNTLLSELAVDQLDRQLEIILSGNYRKGTCPPLWDGHAAERIAAIICDKKV